MTSVIKVDSIQNSSGTSGLTIDSSGNLTAPQQFTSKVVLARIHATSNQSISNASTTTVAFDTVGTDRMSFADVSNNRLTVPSGLAGFYSIKASVRCSNFTPNRAVLGIQKKGADIAATELAGYSANAGEYQWVQVEWKEECAVGDHITATFYHNYGSGQSLYAGGSGQYPWTIYLEMMKIGD